MAKWQRIVLMIIAIVSTIAIYYIVVLDPKNSNGSQAKIYQPLQAPPTKVKPESSLISKCDSFWEAQNQALEKAKAIKHPSDEEIYLYFKSMAWGNAYQNCLTKRGK